MPIYLLVCILHFHPLLGLFVLIGALLLFGLAYLTEVSTHQAAGRRQPGPRWPRPTAFANNNLRNAK